MTKPSYEELAQEEIKRLESELARVRGLLQRQWISVEERVPPLQELVLLANDGEFELGLRGLDGQEWFWCDADGLISEKFYEFGVEGSTVTHWQPIVPPNFPQSSSLVSQSAESGDIGKLDTADEDENVLCAFCPTRSPDGSMKACLDAGKCLYPYKPVGRFTLTGTESGVEMGKVNRVEEKESVIRDSRIANDPTSQSEGETAFYERLDDMIAKNGGTMPEREDEHE